MAYSRLFYRYSWVCNFDHGESFLERLDGWLHERGVEGARDGKPLDFPDTEVGLVLLNELKTLEMEQDRLITSFKT